MNRSKMIYTVMNGDETLKTGLTLIQAKRFIRENQNKYDKMHVVNEMLVSALLVRSLTY